MEKHGIAYEEHDYPWGWHVLQTAAFFSLEELETPDPDGNLPSLLAVPILKVNDANIFKRNITMILMFCYARAFNVTSWRLFMPDTCLELDQQFDRELGEPANLFFLDIATLARQPFSLTDSLYLPKTRVISALIWPILARIARWFYGLDRKARRDAIRLQIRQSFDMASTILKERMEKDGLSSVHRIPSICKEAKTWNAADLSFACHAQWVLFPATNSEAKHMGFQKFPALAEISDPEDVRFIQEMRDTLAGAYASSVLKRERFVKGAEDRLRQRNSRYESSQNQPWIKWLASLQPSPIFGLIKVAGHALIIISLILASLIGLLGVSFVVSLLAAITIIFALYYGSKAVEWWKCKGSELFLKVKSAIKSK